MPKKDEILRGTPSRRQQAAVSVIRTTDYLRRFCGSVFDRHDVTSQQYNVLRILRGAGPSGLRTLEIPERMIEQTPGITRLLDRLEQKKLVRRERPAGDRRQVLCFVTEKGLQLLRELDGPVRHKAEQALAPLSDAEVERLIGLLERIQQQK